MEKKKYTFIPEGFEKEYEDYRRRMNLEEKMKGLYGNKKFRKDVGKYNIDHDEARKKAEIKALNDAIIRYCNSKNIKLYKIIQNKNSIILTYEQNGNKFTEEFLKEDLLKNTRMGECENQK